MNQSSDLTEAIERAVWHELGKRRWFGKHVDNTEIEALETDLHQAITAVLGGN